MRYRHWNVLGPLCGMAAPALLFIYPGILLGDAPDAGAIERIAAVVLTSAGGTVAWSIMLLAPTVLLRLPKVLRGESAEAVLARASYANVLLAGTTIASWLAVVAALVVF